MKYDLTYRLNGLFADFTPNTDAGIRAWNEFANQNGGNFRVLSIHAKIIAQDLKRAGYSVNFSSRVIKVADTDDLLAQLGIAA